MAKIVLITGGGRSGKSSYAQSLAESLPGPRVYVATAVPFDRELEERIAKHRESRGESPGDPRGESRGEPRGEGSWQTVEEPLDLAHAIRDAPDRATVLVDCLTMWVGNLMWEAENGSKSAGTPTESDVAAACELIVTACRQREGIIVFVTNEVGLGIVPGDPSTRLYRDLLGRCNQVMAAAAGTVILMVSGLPLVLRNVDGLELPAPFPSLDPPAFPES